MACVLGQLGRHAANDQGEAPRSGGSHRVPLGRRCHFTMLGCSACRAATTLDGVDGFEVPSWSAVTAGQRPPIMEVEDREPGIPRQGWQHAAAFRIESSFRTEILMPRMSPVEQALLRSQSGPCAGVPFSACPSSPLTRIDSALFRVLLQRRLHLPLPLSKRICGCGRPLDPFGHHRAACSRTGALRWRGLALESAGARVCREAGGRVVTNMFVRDMDLGVPVAGDNRRLEVVVDGLPLQWRSAVGSGHHTRVLCSWQWRTKTRSSNHGRCGSDPSQEAQREDLLGVDGPRGQGSLGGSRSGGWRQVVSASEVVCGSAGQSPRTGRATSAATRDGTGVETVVVLHPLVCRGSLVCNFSPWSEGDNWC